LNGVIRCDLWVKFIQNLIVYRPYLRRAVCVWLPVYLWARKLEQQWKQISRGNFPGEYFSNEEALAGEYSKPCGRGL